MRIKIKLIPIILGVLLVISMLKMYSALDFKTNSNEVELYDMSEIGNETTNEEIKTSIISGSQTYMMEYSYYEGQKDAIEGRIRIELTESGQYQWIESPWDSGKEPKFNPLTIK